MDRIAAETREALTQKLIARAKGLDRALVAALADELIVVEHASGMGLVAGRFVIRGDDLSLFDAIVGAASVALPATLAPGATTSFAVATALLAGLAKALRDLAMKGSVLRQSEIDVLLYLRARPDGASVAELVRDVSIIDGEAVDAARMSAVLGALANVAVRGGGLRAFVAFDAATERWRSVV